MPVDNPEQILDQLMKDSITNTHSDDPPQGRKMLKEQALAALEAYYKAQASKDMAEVIGRNRECSDKDPKWYQKFCEYINNIKAMQRERAAAKGYKLEGE